MASCTGPYGTLANPQEALDELMEGGKQRSRTSDELYKITLGRLWKDVLVNVRMKRGDCELEVNKALFVVLCWPWQESLHQTIRGVECRWAVRVHWTSCSLLSHSRKYKYTPTRYDDNDFCAISWLKWVLLSVATVIRHQHFSHFQVCGAFSVTVNHSYF